MECVSFLQQFLNHIYDKHEDYYSNFNTNTFINYI